GLEVQNDTAAIITVRQQRIVEMTGYLDRDEALTAADLRHGQGERPRSDDGYNSAACDRRRFRAVLDARPRQGHGLLRHDAGAAAPLRTAGDRERTAGPSGPRFHAAPRTTPGVSEGSGSLYSGLTGTISFRERSGGSSAVAWTSTKWTRAGRCGRRRTVNAWR